MIEWLGDHSQAMMAIGTLGTLGFSFLGWICTVINSSKIKEIHVIVSKAEGVLQQRERNEASADVR